jgi:hypothetical protein
METFPYLRISYCYPHADIDTENIKIWGRNVKSWYKSNGSYWLRAKPRVSSVFSAQLVCHRNCTRWFWRRPNPRRQEAAHTHFWTSSAGREKEESLAHSEVGFGLCVTYARFDNSLLAWVYVQNFSLFQRLSNFYSLRPPLNVSWNLRPPPPK